MLVLQCRIILITTLALLQPLARLSFAQAPRHIGANPALDLADRVLRVFPTGRARYLSNATFSSAAVIHWTGTSAVSPKLYFLRELASKGHGNAEHVAIDTSSDIEAILAKVSRPLSPQVGRLRQPYTTDASNLLSECLQGFQYLETEKATTTVGVCRAEMNGKQTTVLYGFLANEGEARVWIPGRTSLLHCRISPRIAGPSPLASSIQTHLQAAVSRFDNASLLCIGDRGLSLLVNTSGSNDIILVRLNDAHLKQLLSQPADKDGFHKYPVNWLKKRAEFDALVNGSGVPDEPNEFCIAIVSAQPDPILYRRRDPFLWLLGKAQGQ